MGRSKFLFAEPRFLFGVARAVDLFGGFDEYNGSDTEDLADARALRSDWATVDDTIVAAMQRFEQEQSGCESKADHFRERRVHVR